MATSNAKMPAAHPSSADLTPRPWSLPTRIGFRFVFCYLLLLSFGMVGIMREFVIVFSTHAIPTRGVLDPLWLRVVPWVAVHLLGLSMGAVSTVSSDSLFDYVFVVCEVLLAAGATLVWSFLDRRRTEYRVLLAWLRRIVGLVLACMLFTYGTDKIFPIQFGTLSLVRLSRRVGDLDPFNLLWTFMAGSTPYTIFSGAAEILAGVLLLLPRCETVGALFSAAVMTNVFVLNLAYDVPVKLISSHLLLCAIFLAACESQRLVPALLSGRAIAPRPPVSLSCLAWLNRSLAFLIPAAGFAFLAFSCLMMSRYYRSLQARSAPSPLYGIWAVDEFQVRGNPAGPLFTPKLAAELDVHRDEDRWQQLIIDTSSQSAIRLGNDVLDSIVVVVAPDGKTVTLTDPGDAAWKCDLRVERPSANLLDLDGRINGVEASVRLHRLPKEKLLLTNSRFHWVRQE
jgi:uncharacterized membrane protein YphA (DoxX/SURF4 family)